MGGARERPQRHRLVVRVEQAIELGTAGLHALGKHGLGEVVLAHDAVEPTRNDPLDGLGRDLLVKALFLQKVVKRRTDAPPLLHAISFKRFKARSRSAPGVFCVFLKKAWSRTIRPCPAQNSTRAMRPRARSQRTSHNLLPKDRQSGMPIGHENSTSLISSPMIFLSARSRLFSHSRTGSRPDGKA